MGSMIDQLMQQLGGDTMKQIGGMLGTDANQTKEASGAALTALLGGLARNTSKPDGAAGLSQALAKDHDGSLLDNLQGKIGELAGGPGDGIVRHVFGSKRDRVERGLSQTTGLGVDSVSKLLTTLAPVVLGALGKTQREQGMDAQGLAGLLSQKNAELEQSEPQAAGIVGRLLDTDGDGDLDMSDVMKHGRGLLGKFLGG